MKNTFIEEYSGAQPYTVKRSNRKVILRLLHRGGAFSIADISSIVGISRQTVKKVIEYYQEKKLVCSFGKGDSTETGGKKPELFEFCSDTRLICILIGVYDVRIIILDLLAKIHESIILSDILNDSYEKLKVRISESCEKLFQENPNYKQHIYGVSCSIPGIIENDTGILRYNIFRSQWGYDLPIKQDLEQIFPYAKYVFVDNIGRMMGRSLLWNAPGGIVNERIVAVYTSLGISACQITDGKIESGANSLIGELGHMILEPMDEEKCLCGSCGCFEVLTSLERIKKEIATGLEKYPDSYLAGRDIQRLNFDDIFEGSRKTDILSRQIIDLLTKWFGIALRNIALMIDPTMIVFFGNFARADDYFMQRIHEEIAGFRYYPKTDKCHIVYDNRDKFELETIGSVQALVENYFLDEELYI